MSVLRDCIVIEPTPGQWYCLVAHKAYGRLDEPYTQTYGPQPTAEDAYDLMREYEANPGGYTSYANSAMTPNLYGLLKTYPPRKLKRKTP